MTPAGGICGRNFPRLRARVSEGTTVHRDVKGDNILVRVSDRLPVLIDFGSCHFAGAQRLTWQSLPPVTLEYLSPQAGLFNLHLQHHGEGYYTPSPADDLYALGVTAYRLVMGQYPPPMEARQDEQGAWQVTRPDVRPLLESNPRVEPVLREVIVRLLLEAPEARGTAGQVAEALEAVAGGGAGGGKLRGAPVARQAGARSARRQLTGPRGGYDGGRRHLAHQAPGVHG